MPKRLILLNERVREGVCVSFKERAGTDFAANALAAPPTDVPVHLRDRKIRAANLPSHKPQDSKQTSFSVPKRASLALHSAPREVPLLLLTPHATVLPRMMKMRRGARCEQGWEGRGRGEGPRSYLGER
eukprot:161806-Rhodomonas_salina.3